MKKYIIAICFFLIIINLYCQERLSIETYEPMVIPPNPTVCQFLSYGNIPVVNCTGTFTYSIPIYTVTNNDINLPISINYSSNGVKVDAMASVTGTDWNLSAGGIVTRIMNGHPDENSNRWFTETIDVNSQEKQADILNLCKGISLIDTEQDWFSFNINGISGTFFFDQQMNIHINCEEYVKIEFSSNNQTSTFTITDKEGYKYIFGGSPEYLEKTDSYNESDFTPNTISCYSSWHLKEIISPSNNKITFSYISNELNYISGVNENLQYLQQEDLLRQYRSSGQQYSSQRIISTSPVLKKINVGNDSIIFNYRSNSNFEGKIYLEEIIIKHLAEEIKKVRMEYDLIACSGEIWNAISSDKTILKNRLFLKNLSFTSPQGAVTEQYSFEYHKLNELPARLSYSKDKFGFPGYSNNSAFSKKLWEEEVSRYKNIIGDISYKFTANTDVNPDNVYAGMLKKIIYPTGGYTQIDYEANSTKELAVVGKNQISKMELKINCGSYNSTLQNPGFKYITIGDGFDLSKQLNISGNFIAGTGCSPGNQGTFSLRVKNLNTNTSILSKDFEYGPDYILPNSTLVFNESINLSPYVSKGDVITIEIVPDDISRLSGEITADVSYTENEQEDTYIYGSGARVKEIADYSENNTYNKRTFYYNNIEKYPSPQTSIQFGTPSYQDYVRDGNYGLWVPVSAFCCLEPRDMIYISSSTFNSPYRNRSQSTNYTVITELLEENGSYTGAIERKFKKANTPNNSAIILHGPFPTSAPTISNENETLKDKIETEKMFRYQNGRFVLASRKDYFYNKVYADTLYSNVFSCMDQFALSYYYDNLNTLMNYISIAQYRNYIETYKIENTTDSLFESTGCIVKNTDYRYSLFPLFNIKKQQESLSNGDLFRTEYFYANDLSDINMDNLIKANRVGEPIIIEQTKNNAVQSIKKEYSLYNSNLLLPKYVYSKTGDNSYEIRLTYHNYDSHGNPIFVSKDNADNIVYLWSYNYQYPIAEIKNATFAEVEAAAKSVFSVANTDSLSTQPIPNESKLQDGSLQKALPNALVTTYTYKPLVGMATMTDPRGVVTKYDYDAFGRLNKVTQADKAIEYYDYHYKN